MIVINCVGPRLIGSRSGEQVAAKRIGSPSPMAKVSGQQPAPPASPRYALVCEYGALLIVIGPLALFTPLLPPVAAGLTFGGLLIAAGLGGAIVFATARRRGLCLATALGGSRHTDRPSRSVPSLDGCFLAAPDTGRRGHPPGLARRRPRRAAARSTAGGLALGDPGGLVDSRTGRPARVCCAPRRPHDPGFVPGGESRRVRPVGHCGWPGSKCRGRVDVRRASGPEQWPPRLRSSSGKTNPYDPLPPRPYRCDPGACLP